ncbi:RidA family protein [Caballeronia sp. 15711]|uniref:RidA family protein n=1 Tax=Caballeronia sp. 15711 TaxID=3391029 RepID=UPI0039E535F3
MSSYTEKLEGCGVDWPQLSRPDLPFSPTKRIGDFLYVSGQIPEVVGEVAYVGRVGQEVDIETALNSARICAANIIYWVDNALNGDLDRVVQLAKLTIFINAIPGFTAFSQIGNGASEVMNAVFGERGEHARSAIGMAGLPANVPVEIEAVFHVR